VNEAAAARVAAGAPTNVRWVVLLALGVVSFVSYTQRLNIAVSADSMMNELAIDNAQMGIIFACYTWGYALFQLPGGLFGQRFGLRRTLAVAAALWSVMTLLTGLLPGTLAGTAALMIGGLAGVRFLLGVLQAPLYPITAAAICNWFPVARWALPNGALSAALTLGAAFTPLLVAPLLVQIGWRNAFYVTAALPLVAAVVWWQFGRDRPDEHPAVNPAERALIVAGRESSCRPPTPRAWRRLLANRETLLLMLSYASMNYVFYMFTDWFPTYLIQDRGFTVLQGGVLASLPFIAGAAGALAGGEICDRLCRRIGPRWGCRVPAVGGLVLVALLLGAGALATNPYLAAGLLALCFGCTQLTEGAYWAGQTYVAGADTAAGTGMMNTGGNLGGVVSSPVVGALSDQVSWLAALLSGSGVALFAAGLWLLIRTDRPADGAPA
jgi:ACS family glucarate transporter-like MFS transporter